MDTLERKQFIMRKLHTDGHVTIADLSDKLGVSSMTIRRDLAKLADDKLIIVEHGGAVLSGGSLFEYSVPLKQREKILEKTAISQKALEYIRDGSSIFLDGGTTTAEIARLLYDKKNLIVLTNSLLAANLLSNNNVKTIMCPGEFRDTSMAYIGPLTDAFISQFKIDLLFLGVEGIDLTGGLSVPDVQDGITKRSLVEKSEKVICVADSGKFNKTFLYHICPLSNIDAIITDDGIEENNLNRYRQQGVNIVTAY